MAGVAPQAEWHPHFLHLSSLASAFLSKSHRKAYDVTYNSEPVTSKGIGSGTTGAEDRRLWKALERNRRSPCSCFLAETSERRSARSASALRQHEHRSFTLRKNSTWHDWLRLLTIEK